MQWLSSALSMHMGAPPPPPTPRRLIFMLESVLTFHQSSLQEQLRLQSQQLDKHSSDLLLLYTRSDAILHKYAGEMQAAQARTNHALDNNKKMLRDIEQMITNSRRSLRLAPLTFTVSPDPVPIPLPVSQSAPPLPRSLHDVMWDDNERAHTSPPRTEKTYEMAGEDLSMTQNLTLLVQMVNQRGKMKDLKFFEEVEDEDIVSARLHHEEQAHAESEPTIRIHTMRATAKPKKPMEFRTTVRRRDSISNAQPDRDPDKQAVLSAMVEVAGGLAYTTFDSRSTTNGLTPEYCHIMRTPKVVLDEQVMLQLGCLGSRSKINFGMRTPVSLGPIKNQDTYFDIVNLDRYNCVFGTPFMNEHGIVLDFKKHEIVIGGQRIHAFTHEEDSAFRANHR
ncbi:hypothetical protein V8D89_007082 [Ganoderma adspersum]